MGWEGEGVWRTPKRHLLCRTCIRKVNIKFINQNQIRFVNQSTTSLRVFFQNTEVNPQRGRLCGDCRWQGKVLAGSCYFLAVSHLVQFGFANCCLPVFWFKLENNGLDSSSYFFWNDSRLPRQWLVRQPWCAASTPGGLEQVLWRGGLSSLEPLSQLRQYQPQAPRPPPRASCGCGVFSCP